MERFFSLFLTLLIWRGSSGFAVWNQKPENYWQGAGLVPQTVQGSGTWTQVPQSSLQAGSGVSASSAQLQSYDQSAIGSSWFVPLRQGVPPVSQTQNISPGPQSHASQSSLQAGASVSAFPVFQQSYDQSVGGSNWFGSSGQWVPPVSQAQIFNPVPPTVPSSGSWTQVQGVSPGQGPSSSAVQAPLTRPVPASGNVANLYSTAQGGYGLQSSDFPSLSTQHQRPSPVTTQFLPSQNAGQVIQGATSSGASKWLKVLPPVFNPAWSSVTPPAQVPLTNNLYASLSQVAAPSADARFQSAGLGSAFQTSGFSTTNSAPVFLSSSSVLPPLNLGVSTQGPLTWQSTGSSQSALQGSASVGPAVQSNPLSSSSSRLTPFLPGATSSFSLVPGPNSQASYPYAQTPAVRLPSNQLNFNTVRPGSSSSVKG